MGRANPNSFLNWLERIIRMRKEMSDVGCRMSDVAWGDFTIVPTGASDVLVPRYLWRDTSVLVMHNFSVTAREITFAFPDPDDADAVLVNLLSQDHSPADARGNHTILLEPYGYRWFRGLDHVLRRGDF